MNRQDLENAIYPYYNAETDLIDMTALCAALGVDEVLATFTPADDPDHDAIIRAALRHNRIVRDQSVAAPLVSGWLRFASFALALLAGIVATVAPFAALAL